MTTPESRSELIFRLRERARIRRQIPGRKSVQEGSPDRIADLLEEAADALSSEQTLNMDAPKAATDYRDAARYRWLRERVTYRDQESLSPMKYYYRRWFHDTAYKLDADTAAGMFDASIDEGMKPRIEREYK